MKYLARFYLWLIGWKIVGVLPPQVRKCVMVAAPHTSNYDYPITLSVFYAKELPIRFLAKDSLFRFPLGILMRASGGIPVERSRKHNLVDSMIKMFNEREELVLLVPVEGTRSYVKEWKSGFYHTAVGAGVPIALGFLDYGRKEAGYGELFYPTGDYAVDLLSIQTYYRQFTAKYPDKSSLNA